MHSCRQQEATLAAAGTIVLLLRCAGHFKAYFVVFTCRIYNTAMSLWPQSAAVMFLCNVNASWLVLH